jgi:hypothetical protein
MDESALNMSVRRFLKEVGVTSQREIETAVRDAVAAGRLKDGTTLSARMELRVEALGLAHVVEGTILLEGTSDE